MFAKDIIVDSQYRVGDKVIIDFTYLSNKIVLYEDAIYINSARIKLSKPETLFYNKSWAELTSILTHKFDYTTMDLLARIGTMLQAKELLH